MKIVLASALVVTASAQLGKRMKARLGSKMAHGQYPIVEACGEQMRECGVLDIVRLDVVPDADAMTQAFACMTRQEVPSECADAISSMMEASAPRLSKFKKAVVGMLGHEEEIDAVQDALLVRAAPLLGQNGHGQKKPDLFGQDGHGQQDLLGRPGHGRPAVEEPAILGEDGHGQQRPAPALIGQDGHGQQDLLGRDGHGRPAVEEPAMLGEGGHGQQALLGRPGHGTLNGEAAAMLGRDGHGQQQTFGRPGEKPSQTFGRPGEKPSFGHPGEKPAHLDEESSLMVDAPASDLNGVMMHHPKTGGERGENGCLGGAGYTWCESSRKCIRAWEEDCIASSEPEIPVRTPPARGSKRDEHGCVRGAGYSWCEGSQKCVRAWEEPCVIVAELVQAPALIGQDGHGQQDLLGRPGHGRPEPALLGQDGHGQQAPALIGQDGHGQQDLLGRPGHGRPAPVGASGSKRDEHDCIPSAGYMWCEASSKCIRPWEEECVVATEEVEVASNLLLG